MTTHFITHGQYPKKLPSTWWSKIFFYTSTNENPEKFFVGVDNNPLDKHHIETLLWEKKIFALLNPIILDQNSELALYVNHLWKLFMAHYKDSSKNIVQIEETISL